MILNNNGVEENKDNAFKKMLKIFVKLLFLYISIC